VARLCRVLGVSRSGYYAWRARLAGPPGRRVADDLAVLDQIRQLHARFACYGSPRIHRELQAHQVRVGRHRVARLMRQHAIVARRGSTKRARSVPPQRRPEIGDRVRRQFTSPAPDRLWCTDITMIRTRQGWLRAAVILDVFSRKVISWSVDNREDPQTALRALREAIAIRRPRPGCVLHSDRGYQFTSWQWLDTATSAGLLPSIGERNSALDNAMIESWFAALKNETIYPAGDIATTTAARRLLFDHIVFHNTQRRHSALGYHSPDDYENLNPNLST
jgi:putative transposase